MATTATNGAVSGQPETKKCDSEVVVVEKPCDKAGGVSNIDKWIIAGILAAVFILLVLPWTFRLTNVVVGWIGFKTVDKKGRPTIAGIIIHAVIFFLIVRLLMH